MKLPSASDFYGTYETSRDFLKRYYKTSKNFLSRYNIVDKAAKGLISAVLMGYYSPDVGANTRLSEILTGGSLKDTITGLVMPLIKSSIQYCQYYFSNSRHLF